MLKIQFNFPQFFALHLAHFQYSSFNGAPLANMHKTYIIRREMGEIKCKIGQLNWYSRPFVPSREKKTFCFYKELRKETKISNEFFVCCQVIAVDTNNFLKGLKWKLSAKFKNFIRGKKFKITNGILKFWKFITYFSYFKSS